MTEQQVSFVIGLILTFCWQILLAFALLYLAITGQFRRMIDDQAEAAARPILWRQAIGIGVFILAVYHFKDGEWLSMIGALAVIIFMLYLRNRNFDLEYYRKRGIDPYNKAQVKADDETLKEEMRKHYSDD